MQKYKNSHKVWSFQCNTDKYTATARQSSSIEKIMIHFEKYSKQLREEMRSILKVITVIEIKSYGLDSTPKFFQALKYKWTMIRHVSLN